MKDHQPPRCLQNKPKLNLCIYCGTRQGPFSREHIVPFALGGTATLPKGSCDACSKITQSIESHCLEQTLIHVRTSYQMKTRTPGARKKSFPIKFQMTDGSTTEEQIAVQDYPLGWIMPIWEQPHAVLGIEPSVDLVGNLLFVFHDPISRERARALLARPGVHSFTAPTAKINPAVFHRWIAKVAYSFAVGVYSYELVCRSPLRDIVIKGTLFPNQWIGSLYRYDLSSFDESQLEAAEPYDFMLCTLPVTAANGAIYVAVVFRPLAFLAGPSYLALVCERTDEHLRVERGEWTKPSL